jgi:CRP/FNR family cyclic AMP-dependent transcriptional regulator
MLTHDSKEGLLKRVPLFSECSSSELERLSERLTEVEVEDGTDVVRQGDATREFYVIVSGTANAFRDGRVLRTLGPGDFFGEISSLCNARRTATVTATSTLQLLVTEEPGFRELIEGTRGLHRKMIDALAQRLAPTAL